MVDCEARRRAAQLVRRFGDGEITNDEFEDDWPDSRDDRALRAVGTMLWGSYSDLYPHRLVGKHALAEEGRRLFRRCALFLESDREYEWPRDSFTGIGGFGPVIRVLTLGLSYFADRWIERGHRRARAELEAAGDFGVWPFLQRADYEAACQRAVLKD
jgi:hypothetical protein